MRNLFMILFMSIATLSFAHCDIYMPTKRTKSGLPKRVLNLVNNTDSVIGYRVDAMNAPNDSSEIICGYTVMSRPKNVGKQNAEKLQELVKLLSTVKQGDVRKLSTFIPDYGFKFMAGKYSVIMLLDQHADLCTLYYRKKQFLLDTDSLKSTIGALLHNVWGKGQLTKEKTENSITQAAIIETNATAATDNTSKNRNDSTPKAPQYIKLQVDILNIIKTAPKLTMCMIAPFTKGDKDMERLGEYVVLQKKEVTDKKQIKAASDLLTGEKSFEKLDFAKNCTFLPDIALQINSGKKTLNILFSFYCSECMMLLDDKQVFRNDCSLIQTKMINLAKQIYPKDKYLRTIIDL